MKKKSKNKNIWARIIASLIMILLIINLPLLLIILGLNYIWRQRWIIHHSLKN
jgi:hypothetical protein